MTGTPISQRRLLVIGSGFIGASLALEASQEWSWQVHVLYRKYLNPRLLGLPCDLLPDSVQDTVRLLDIIAPTDVVIALGSSFVPEINRDLDNALTQHLNGPMMVLDALSRMSSPLTGKILVLGSASEYGEFDDNPVNEEHPSKPKDHYGVIKLALRHIGLHFHQHHGLPIIHVRQFNVTGPEQDDRFVLPSICRQIASAAVGSTQRIVAGNVAVSRDFLYISDVCNAYRELILLGSPGNVYNVCSGQTHMISDLINLAAELRGVRVEIAVSEQLLRENDKVQSIICGDPSRLMKLGWEPKVTIRTILVQLMLKYASS